MGTCCDAGVQCLNTFTQNNTTQNDSTRATTVTPMGECCDTQDAKRAQLSNGQHFSLRATQHKMTQQVLPQ